VWGDRAFFEITIFNYKESPVGAYGEHTFSIPVVRKDSVLSYLPLLPMILKPSVSKLNHLVTLMGVSNDISRKHIEILFPYSLFEKNLSMEIKEDINNNHIIAKISFEQEDVLSARVEMPKRFKIKKENVRTAFEKGGELFQVDLNVFAYIGTSLYPNLSAIKLGANSPFEEYVSDIHLDPKPILAIYYKHAIEIASLPQKIF
jgi:hypothetical protein